MGAFAFLTSVSNVLHFTIIIVDGIWKLEMYVAYKNTDYSFIIINKIRKIKKYILYLFHNWLFI